QMSATPDLVICMEVNEVSKLRCLGVESDVYNIKGLPWRMTVSAFENGHRKWPFENVHFGKELHVEIDCNWPSSAAGCWSCHASIDTVIVRSGGEDGKIVTSNVRFSHHETNSTKALDFAEIVDPKNGYVMDDRIVVECRVFIHKTAGVRKPKSADCTTPQEGHNNVVLVVDGKKLHLSKDYLAIYSPVFSAMFFGHFTEKNKNEIELKGVKYEEFVDVLNMIYPTSHEVNGDNFRHILNLADRFQIECASERVEKFLMATKMFRNPEKLVFADEFRLTLLRDHCLASFKVVNSLNTLKKSIQYRSFSDEMREAIDNRLNDF
ncbi:hypothetical protein PFISCL1PPCAC_21268, partial [Pristionchus fissidentatus]